jgi:hypothetical protein
MSIKLELNSLTPLAQGEVGAQRCINADSNWCFRWEAGETDNVLQEGETVEIFVGAANGPIHQLEKHTQISIEVILPDGAVVMINAKMPPVIFQVMDIAS